MKRYRIISLILVIILMFNTVVVMAAEDNSLAYNLGRIDGRYYGEIEAIRNSEEGNFIGYANAMGSKDVIIAGYSGTAEEKEEYYKGYVDGFKEEYERVMAAKSSYAQRLGSSLGAVHGARDYINSNYYPNSIPNPNQVDNFNIIEMYNLQGETPEYRARFIGEFKNAYKISYLVAFEKTNLEPDYSSMEAGKAHGTALGSQLGTEYGRMDFEKRYSMDYKRRLPSDQEIIRDYTLNKDNADYRNAFINNFKIAFELSYNKGFRDANLEFLEGDASNQGKTKGFARGKGIAEENRAKGIQIPVDQVRLTEQQIKTEERTLLLGKSPEYIAKFVTSYQENFTLGYNSVIMDTDTYNLGYNKGSTDGKKLVEENTSSTYKPYELVKLTDDQVKTKYFNELKDKDINYINEFIKGYQEGFKISYNQYKDIGEATNEGKEKGFADGKWVANYNKGLGLQIPVEQAKLTNEEVKTKYSVLLADKNHEYILIFVTSYQENFKLGYESIISDIGVYDNGYNKGFTDGKKLAEENTSGTYKTYEQVKLTDDQVKTKYFNELKDKDINYINEFIKGYQEGFKVAYNQYKDIGEATNEGKVKGLADGKWVGNYNKELGLQLPIEQVRLTEQEIKDKYKELLLGKSSEFVQVFITTYQDNFKIGYESIIFDKGVYDTGYNKGYTDGKNLAELNNGKEDFKPYGDVKLTDSEVETKYYNELKDKNVSYIKEFVSGYQAGFEKAYSETILSGEANDNGYKKGLADGKKIAEDNSKAGIILPLDMVKLTDEQVKVNYKVELAGKSNEYISNFLIGYQKGFKEGYNSVLKNDSVVQEGYLKGYSYGSSLALKSNVDGTFIPLEKAKIDRNQAMTLNYDYLKDKTSDFIILFINGFLDGFEQGYKDNIKVGGNIEEAEGGVALSAGFGAAFGMNYGEIAGLQDYERGVSPNWSRAIPKDTELDRLFNLRNLPREERNAFIEQFRKNFEIGYEKAYYEGHFGAIRNSLTAGTADGSQFGGNLGAIFGAKDFYEGRDSDYKRDLPSDYIIESEYALNLDNKEYMQGFVNGFKKAYQEQYILSFREAKNNAFLMDQSMGYENGLSVGNIQGSTQATMDYMQKKTNDWNRSKPAASSIIFEYNLMYQPEKYRDSFISGFWDGYLQGYTDTYKEVSQTTNETKTVSETIPISGGTLMSLDGAMAVTIKPGTYYKPVILKIDTLNDSLYSFDKNYISASNYYKISLINPNNNAFNNDSKIELSFEYYGGKKGGVYKMQNGQWQYMDSTRDDSSITIMVNPRNLLAEGSVYAVMLNEEVKTFHDIRGHWAKDEIETLIRRNIIYGYTDNTFKPENKITRAEFLTLLSRVYKWQLPTYTANTMQFKDYASFGNRNNIISYALAHGYINGYPDNTFRPNDHISYRELEIIMRRFIDKDFKWHHTAAKMLYEKKARTSFYDSIDNKINRGEVSYMLYILNDWRY